MSAITRIKPRQSTHGRGGGWDTLHLYWRSTWLHWKGQKGRKFQKYYALISWLWTLSYLDCDSLFDSIHQSFDSIYSMATIGAQWKRTYSGLRTWKKTIEKDLSLCQLKYIALPHPCIFTLIQLNSIQPCERSYFAWAFTTWQASCESTSIQRGELGPRLKAYWVITFQKRRQDVFCTWRGTWGVMFKSSKSP